MTYTDRIVNFIIDTDYDAIPSAALDMAKVGFFDCIGVGLAGSQQPAGNIGAKWAKNNAGKSESTVWGQRFKTSAHDAGLVNGTSAHALDFDDVTWGLIGHPSVSLTASTLALGETIGASGRDVLLAYVVGFEVMAKIGRTTQPLHSQTAGWHPTSSIGSFGSCAACCKLLGLDRKQTAHALGMILSMTSGNVINFGTMTKPFHAGLAARNAIEAAQWSQLGFTATSQPFDGKRSFNNTYSRGLPCDMAPLDELGKVYELIERGIVIKPYPCGVASHPAIDAVLDLRENENLRAEQVQKIEVGVTTYTYDKLSYAKPGNALEGKFSMAYPVARALLDGRLDLDNFQDKDVQNPTLQDLIARSEMYEDEEIQRNWNGGSRPCRLRVHLKNGNVLEKLVNISKGNPEVPLSRDELRVKFSNCAKLCQTPEDTKQIMAYLENIEQVESISTLTDLLAG